MKKIIFSAVFAAMFISTSPLNSAEASVRMEFIRDDGRGTVCDTEVDGDGGNVTSAVRKAATNCHTTYELKYWESWSAHTLEKFAGAGGWAKCYWTFDVNSEPSKVGMDDKTLEDGDRVTWTLNNSSSCRYQGAYSTAGEGIVGLINPSTGGRLDTDGDGIADVDEYANGTDPKVRDNPNSKREEKKSSLASASASIDLSVSGMKKILEDAKESLIKMLSFLTKN